MVRIARNRAQLRSAARILLREPAGGSSGWSDAELNDIINRCKDRRDMQIQGFSQGYGIAIHDIDLVKDQTEVELPTEASRVHRVLRFLTEEGVYIPLEREEHIDSPEYNNTGVLAGVFTSSTYIPTYRLVDNFILLSPPPPTAITLGLRIEVESPADRLEEDTDTLPDAWPIFIEDLIIYDTTIEAYNMEDAISAAQEATLHSLVISRKEYEADFLHYVSERNHSPTYTSGFGGGPA